MGKTNIFLVGMAGVGKTTHAKLLAKNTELDFIDTDDLLELVEGDTGVLLSEKGENYYLQAEEKIMLGISKSSKNIVFSSGGSCIYSEAGMEYVKQFCHVVYLVNSADNIRANLAKSVSLEDRGVIGCLDMTMEELLAQRHKLYIQHSDLQINLEECNGDLSKESKQIFESVSKSGFVIL